MNMDHNRDVLKRMRIANPYESPAFDSDAARPSRRQRNAVKRCFLGAILGASLPAMLGAYGLHQFSIYVASLPPNQPGCGNGAIGPMMLLVFVAPIMGLLGSAIALASP